MSDHNPPSTLSGDDLAAWASLETVMEWLPSALDAQLLRDSEVTHYEYGILFALANARDHTLRMSVLADYANSSLSRLSRAAKRLEDRGWMRRSPDPDDGRYTRAMLTEEGRVKYDEATPGHVQTVNQLVLEPLTASQRRQLREISRRIQRAIRQDAAWQPRETERVR
jgi:DNA-binding MarR family transcriptional regulator